MVNGETCLDCHFGAVPRRQLTSGTEFGETYFQSVPQARLFSAGVGYVGYVTNDSCVVGGLNLFYYLFWTMTPI